MVSTESMAKRLDGNDANELKQRVSKALHRAELPKKNMNGQMLRAVKGLWRSKDRSEGI